MKREIILKKEKQRKATINSGLVLFFISLIIFIQYYLRESSSYRASEYEINKIIAGQLNMPVGMLTDPDFKSIKKLQIEGDKITNLKPLKKLTNLQSLVLYRLEISNISALAKLPKLNALIISGVGVYEKKTPAWLVHLKKFMRIKTDSSSLPNPISLRPLKKLPDLKSLSIYGTRIKNPNIIKDLKFIEYLELDQNRITDIHFLANKYKLKHLKIHYNDITDIKPIKSLKNLEELSLFVPVKIDPDMISGLTKLNALYLHEPGFLDLTPLTKLENMRDFTFIGSNGKQLIDISPLAEFKNLNSLSLALVTVSNSKVFSELKNLEKLSLDSISFNKDFSPIKNLINLRTLNLSGSNVNDLSFVKDLTKLETLDLSLTSVNDISSLNDLTNLKKLSLNLTSVSNLSPLENLTKLEVLYLINCRQINDITPLEKIKNLKILYLEGTNVNNEQIEKLKDVLPNLEIIEIVRYY